MSEAPKRKAYQEALVSCTSCGKTSPTYVREHPKGGLMPRAKCPKCSNLAYVNNLAGYFAFMQGACQEIARLKLELMDVQSAGEEAER